ncbi:alkaline phosphatase family protein [Melioribacteraceae bacterium 4301-Me]|uniref:alkaline phosphatase family protein n=1 Tax=Pyranulibacter aquaticus TaxID=3163344 RepID=UPI003594B95B
MKQFFKILTSFLLAFTILSAQHSPRPKLVVGIVIDQMRYDYLKRFEPLFGEDGFKRLERNGCNFTFAHFNYVPTYTAPGHASIYTGTTPYYHGIIANDWYDKTTKKMISSVESKSYSVVGSNAKKAASPNKLMATTITDQLKIVTNNKARVFSVSLKDRAAVLSGGHLADAAYWYDDSSGNFVSSSYYMKSLPQWVIDFNNKKLAEKFVAEKWELSFAKEKYLTNNDKSKKLNVFNEENTNFPHSFENVPSENKYQLLEITPFGNELLLKFVQELIQNEKIGQNKFTDFLAVSFSSTDYIGHKYGPNSLEVEDTYVKLDRQIAELLNTFDKYVGKGNYLLFLTADHGVAESIDFLEEEKLPTGFLNTRSFIDSLSFFVGNTFGNKNLIENYSNNQIFLNHELINRMKLNKNEVIHNIADFVRENFPEVIRVFTSDVLEKEIPSRNKNNFVLNGFNPVRSGDIILELRPDYFSGDKNKFGNAATHGTSYNYDTHVPLIFFGWNVPSMTVSKQVFVVDIAPTISNLLGIDEPDACYGIPLIELTYTK